MDGNDFLQLSNNALACICRPEEIRVHVSNNMLKYASHQWERTYPPLGRIYTRYRKIWAGRSISRHLCKERERAIEGGFNLSSGRTCLSTCASTLSVRPAVGEDLHKIRRAGSGCLILTDAKNQCVPPLGGSTQGIKRCGRTRALAEVTSARCIKAAIQEKFGNSLQYDERCVMCLHLLCGQHNRWGDSTRLGRKLVAKIGIYIEERHVTSTFLPRTGHYSDANAHLRPIPDFLDPLECAAFDVW